MALGEFTFPIRGDVKISYQWGNKETEFESGLKQYPRKRIRAKKSYSFKMSGTKSSLESLVNFYNDQRGLLRPFWFAYDGKRELCHFGNALDPQLIRELGKVVGFTCEVVLNVEKQTVSYPTPSESDILPKPRKEVTHTIDWNTQTIDMGAVGYRWKQKTPTEKLSVKFSGKKPIRDTIISLFNSHCKTPLKIEIDEQTYSVMFEDKLDITDKREGQSIIGFECSMDLEVVRHGKH